MIRGVTPSRVTARSRNCPRFRGAAGNAPAVKLLANLRDMYAGGPVAPYGPGKVVVPMDNDLRLITPDPKDPSKWKNVSLGKLALDSNQAWIQNVCVHDGRVSFVQQIGTNGDVFRVKLDGTELENISAHKGSTYLDTIHGVAVTSAGVFWTGYVPGVAFKPHGSDHEVRIPVAHRSVNQIAASGSSVFWIDAKDVWIGSVDPQTTEASSRPLVDSTVNPPDVRVIAVDAKRAY